MLPIGWFGSPRWSAGIHFPLRQSCDFYNGRRWSVTPTSAHLLKSLRYDAEALDTRRVGHAYHVGEFMHSCDTSW